MAHPFILLRTVCVFLFTGFLSATPGDAQTPRQVIIEHFTNTRCSICASKNPGFYNTLHGSYPQLLHIAYHPSAPYSACLFSQQNKNENDARTNFYGVYGSTPRAVVQGKVIPAVNPLVPIAAIDSTLNLFSPFQLDMRMRETLTDSIEVRWVVTATDAHAYTNLNLFAAITEDTIFYNAPNGEKVHYDVFRKQLFTGNGYSFSAPVSIGDSVVITATFLPNPSWSASRINLIGMIQEPVSKYIAQSAKQTRIDPLSVPTSITNESFARHFSFYPNPATSAISFVSDVAKDIRIFNSVGEILMSHQGIQDKLSVASLQPGFYFLEIRTDSKNRAVHRLTVIR